MHQIIFELIIMKHKILTFFLACLVPWLAGAQQSANSQNNVAEKDYIAYLFTYFTGNHISEEAVCYAVSTDGYTYWALNDNKPVIDSKIISSTGGDITPLRRSAILPEGLCYVIGTLRSNFL